MTERWINSLVCLQKGVGDGQGRAVGQQGLQPEGEEDQDVEDKLFNHPLGALVKNCNMLHNIVGPACIFLKQGFSQTLVCSRATNSPTPISPGATLFFFFFLHSCVNSFSPPASWPLTLPPCHPIAQGRVRPSGPLAHDQTGRSLGSMEIIDGLCGGYSDRRVARGDVEVKAPEELVQSSCTTVCV